MRKVNYPADMSKLLAGYLKLFPVKKMQKTWKSIRNDLKAVVSNPNFDTVYPNEIKDILVADYPKLVDIYIDYCRNRNNRRISDDIDVKLKELFNYSGDFQGKFQPTIAEFFMQHADELNILVCHYCELSYVNAYGLKNKYKSFHEFLNNADDREIRRLIRGSDGKELSESTYRKIFAIRDEAILNEKRLRSMFDSIHPTWKQGKGKSEDVMNKLHNHFDLDHFLPKSKCPIVGLSFKNFVPSCSVCNEKLKRDDMLGNLNRDDLLRLSPTSNLYDFDENVKISIEDVNDNVNHLRMQEHPSDFRICFETDDELIRTEIIDEFYLEERYNYHKCEALRLHDLMLDYPDVKIESMSDALGNSRTVEQIKEDLFGLEFSKDNNRCMDKMRRDVLSHLK